MEGKAIVYIIAGVIYFLYSLSKKAQENQKKVPGASIPVPPKSVSPPVANPLKELQRQNQRKTPEPQPQARPAAQSVAERKELLQGKDLFIREKRAAIFGQGTNDSPIYEDISSITSNAEQEQLKHETAYQPLPVDANDTGSDYEFDARNAFIGSVIFERKY